MQNAEVDKAITAAIVQCDYASSINIHERYVLALSLAL